MFVTNGHFASRIEVTPNCQEISIACFTIKFEQGNKIIVLGKVYAAGPGETICLCVDS